VIAQVTVQSAANFEIRVAVFRVWSPDAVARMEARDMSNELFWNEEGAFACPEHAAQLREVERPSTRWRVLCATERTEFELELGRAPMCDLCAEIERNAEDKA
jgi:hypothetical protein